MIDVAVSRRIGLSEIPLTEGPDGYLCHETDTIVLRIVSANIPELRLCAETLPLRSIRQSELGFETQFEKLIDVWAGRTCLTLDDGSTQQILRLDVRPSTSKLSEDAWEAMIRELAQISPGLPWGLSPGAASANAVQDDLSVIHPAIIEEYLPRFSRLLRVFLSEPPTVANRVRTIGPWDAGKRVDLGTMRWLSRRPQDMFALSHNDESTALLPKRPLIDQAAVVNDFDHPMTRYVHYLLTRLEMRFSRTCETLRQTRGHGVPDPALTAYARQLSEIVERSRDEIVRGQRNPVIRSTKATPATDSILQALPDHPLWSGIHRVAQILLHPGLLYAPGQTIFSALKQSYDLFEVFVLYRLVDGLEKGLPNGWMRTRSGEVSRLALEDRPADRAIWAWTSPQGAKLELHYQRRFRSCHKADATPGFNSITAQGVPDYVLVHSRDGEVLSWIILDAKYRSSRQSIHDALAEMHIYRDKLRLNGQVASGAFIIVPALHYRASAYGAADYHSAHDLGALVVGPEDWISPLWSRLGLPIISEI